MKIKIHITKEILQRSMLCGVNEKFVSKSCAIALAVKDIFPDALVGIDRIFFSQKFENIIGMLPKMAIEFIKKFDSLNFQPEKRLELPELSFEVEVPDCVIDKIGIEEAYRLINESPTVELV